MIHCPTPERRINIPASITFYISTILCATIVFLVALLLFTVSIRAGTVQRAVIGSASDHTAAIGFHDRENNEHEHFRWSDGDSLVRLFGLEAAQTVVASLDVTAPIMPPMPRDISFWSGSRPLTTTQVASTWREYTLLLPRGSRWRPVELRLQSTTSAVMNDQRTLGVAVQNVRAAPLQGRNLRASVEYSAFLAVCVAAVMLMSWWATGHRLVGFILAGIVATALAVWLRLAPASIARVLPPLWYLVVVGLSGLCVIGTASLLRSSARPAWSFWVGLAMLALGQVLLSAQVSVIAGGIFVLAGAVMISASALARPATNENARSAWEQAALLGLCFLLALGLRLYQLDQVPFGLWRDEARHGLLALRILNDATYRPVYVPGEADLPALLFYLQAVPIRLFGPTTFAVRLVPALAGSLTVLPAFFVGRSIFGVHVGFVASYLLAVSSWHIALSRIAFPTVLDPLCTLTAIALLSYALKRTSRITWRHAAAAAGAGLATGIAAQTYHTGRLVPFALAALIMLQLDWQWRAWRRAAPLLAVFTVAALLAIAPLLQYALLEPDGFNRRVGQVGLVAASETASSSFEALQENIVRYLLMWNVVGERNARHHVPLVPMVDALTACAFVVGVLLLFLQWRQSHARLVAALLLIGLLPGVLSSDAPHAMRAVGAIVPTMFIAAYGLVSVARSAPVSKITRYATVPTMAVVTMIGLLNVWRYFGFMPYDAAVWAKFQYTRETAIAMYIQHMEQPVIVPPDVAQTDVFRYLTYNLPYDSFNPGDLPSPDMQPADVLIPTDADTAVSEWVRHAPVEPSAIPMHPYPGSTEPTFWLYRAARTR